MTPHVSITLLRTQSDERLVALTRAGHDRAFEAIVERYRRPLLRHARRFTPDSRAEDVVQAAFVSAWAALADGIAVRDLRPWLYRIVHNGALNAMKKAGGDDAPLHDLAAPTVPGPEGEAERREDVRRALDGIAALPERQRAALVAVAVDGRSHADVGAELGLNDTAVRQLVSRARTSLRAAATALTPLPLAEWLASTSAQTDTPARIAELVAAGAGSGALVGGAALKTGAVVATVGALAVGTPKVAEVVRDGGGGPQAASADPVRGADAGGPGGSGGEGFASIPVAGAERPGDRAAPGSSGEAERSRGRRGRPGSGDDPSGAGRESRDRSGRSGGEEDDGDREGREPEDEDRSGSGREEDDDAPRQADDDAGDTPDPVEAAEPEDPPDEAPEPEPADEPDDAPDSGSGESGSGEEESSGSDSGSGSD